MEGAITFFFKKKGKEKKKNEKKREDGSCDQETRGPEIGPCAELLPHFHRKTLPCLYKNRHGKIPYRFLFELLLILLHFCKSKSRLCCCEGLITVSKDLNK